MYLKNTYRYYRKECRFKGCWCYYEMEFLITYLNEGHSIVDFLSCIVVVAAIILCVEKVIKWIYDLFLKAYKRRRGQEDETTTIVKNTEQIKNLADTIDNLADLLNKQYQHLDKKIDEQKERITKINEEGKVRDCSILRDRILGALRYFSKNVDEQGRVHISITEHENIEHLFESYFSCNGNGTVKAIYDNEFKNWIIDK